ncbi:MAG: MBL fold metallo-hydrolase [Chloroflexota bacterium]
MIKHIKDDLYQIGECVLGTYGHEAVRAYVMLNQGQPIIVDCGSQLHRTELMRDLETVLADQVPSTVFLTHSELPHVGNLQKIADKWPRIQVVVSNVMLPYIEIAPGIPQEQILAVTPGTSMMVGSRSLTLVDALLKDQPGSHWIYDPQTETLFTGDGFGAYHSPEDCARETDAVISDAAFRQYHRNAFRFLRWVIPERLNPIMDHLFDQYAVSVIAPSHGDAICHDIPAHIEQLKLALADIRQSAMA